MNTYKSLRRIIKEGLAVPSTAETDFQVEAMNRKISLQDNSKDKSTMQVSSATSSILQKQINKKNPNKNKGNLMADALTKNRKNLFKVEVSNKDAIKMKVEAAKKK